MPRVSRPRERDLPEAVRVMEAWFEALGQPLARIASPRHWRDGCLEVAVPDAHWMEEIHDRRAEILERLKRLPDNPGIVDIRVRVEPNRQRLASTLPPLPDRDPVAVPPDEIRDASRQIQDEEIARRWVDAVTRLLTRASDSKPGAA